jgi:hypothetical protein
MQTGTLAIYDLEKEYADSFMQYIGRKQGMPFRTIAFTDKKALYEYLEQNKVEILLISIRDMEKELEEKNIDRIILLSCGEILPEYEDYACIYKYQSSEKIIRELLDYYADVTDGSNLVQVRECTSRITGVYSPVKRAGQTTFALTLGQILATDYRTLYINLEEFAAFDKVFHQVYSGDMSDLMYFYKQNPDSLIIKLKAIVCQIHQMEYVPPLIYSRDLRIMDTCQWISLIKAIESTGMYDRIILDISNVVADVFAVMDICQNIYVPITDDLVSLKKIDSFEEYLLRSRQEHILDKCIKVKVPIEKDEDNFLDRQLWGKLGDYIRELVRESE